MAPTATATAPKGTAAPEVTADQLSEVMDRGVEHYCSYVRLAVWAKRRNMSDAQYDLEIEAFVAADAKHRSAFHAIVGVLAGMGEAAPGVNISRKVVGFRQTDWNGTALADLLTANADKAVKAWAKA